MKRIALLAGLGLGLSTASFAKVCELSISGNDQMKYDKTELVAEKDCTKVKLTLSHSGNLPKTAMGHNWILVDIPDADFMNFAGLGAKAGPGKEYIPQDEKTKKDDKRILAHTKVIGAKETTSVEFDKPKAGTYTYFCSFPGHFAMMKGKFISK